MSDNQFPSTEMDEGADHTVSGDASGQETPDAGSNGEVAPQKSEPKITVKRDGEVLFERSLETFPVSIGRKSENDIVLEEKNVSRKHAQIDVA